MAWKAALLERVAALTPSEWVIAAAVLSLVGAIAWIGRNVSRLIESHAALASDLKATREFAARVDEAAAKRCQRVEARQDRLQSKMENLGRDWRDSMRRTEARNSGEYGLTTFDFRKPPEE